MHSVREVVYRGGRGVLRFSALAVAMTILFVVHYLELLYGGCSSRRFITLLKVVGDNFLRDHILECILGLPILLLMIMNRFGQRRMAGPSKYTHFYFKNL